MISVFSSKLRSTFPIACRIWGHKFDSLHSVTREENGTQVTEARCPCGALLIRQTKVLHGVCPHCGGAVIYDATRPKTYVGTDVYCEEVYGEWYCNSCWMVGDEDFSGDYKKVTECIVARGTERE